MSDPQKHIDELTAVLAATGDSKQALQQICEIYQGGAVFSTSFSEEDQVILHFLSEINTPPSIFTLDTGRLFSETYSTWSRSREKYQLVIQSFHPDHTSLQDFIEAKGPNSFYESIENRKACCFIRKVEPLQRALKGKSIWITGIRAEHSPDRQDMTPLEWDPANQIIKYHPLLFWDHARVKAFIKENDIPYNPMHDKGFVSIGCAPCTRAIQPGEDFRAGRWWWEANKSKECGLHVHQTIEKQI